MLEGIVKRWFIVRGFGFIKCNQYEDEIFVHRSKIRDRSTLRKGLRVRFDVRETTRGPEAVNVLVVEGE